MYTIIGGDGKEYGPVTTEQVRSWIASGRANLETRAKALGTDDWKRLGNFPDFSGAGQTEPPQAGPAHIGGAERIAEEMKARAAKLDISHCYERSWKLLKANFWPLVGVSALVIAIQEVIGIAGHVVGTVVVCFIGAVFTGGLQYYFLKKIRGRPTTIGDAFYGFTSAFLPLVLAGLVWEVFIFFGIILLVLPAIYLAVAYAFTWLLIVDQRLEFWTALEVSRRVITAQWWRLFGLLLLGIVFALLGAALLLVGVFVAIPLIYGALVYAYEDLCVSPRTAAQAPPAG